MSYVFAQMTPGATLSKYNVGLLDTFDDEKKLLNFLRMEKWLADRPHHPGEAAKQLLVNLYKNNELVRGEFQLGGRTVNLADIQVPVLNVFAKDDHIIPPKTTQALRGAVGSKDYTEIGLDGGHVGVFVSGKSQGVLGKGIFDWLKKRDGSRWPALKRPDANPAEGSPGARARRAFAGSPTPSGDRDEGRAHRRLRARRFAHRAATSTCWPRRWPAEGARVIAPDLPGRGRSDWLASPAHYTDRAYTGAMSTLIARLDVEQVDWIGTSLGGHIGMLMAAEYAARRSGAWCSTTSARACRRRRCAASAPTWASAGASRRSTSWKRTCARSMRPSATLTDAQWRHLAQHSAVAGRCRRPALPFRSGHRHALSRFRSTLDVVLWQLWDRIECPVLILRGEDSDLLVRQTTVAEMLQPRPCGQGRPGQRRRDRRAAAMRRR